ncbi:hypothetical protein NL676_010927 [Syzygium grande]|nr:hypothetical protein NL676_010927 [Syzygium grande]
MWGGEIKKGMEKGKKRKPQEIVVAENCCFLTSHPNPTSQKQNIELELEEELLVLCCRARGVFFRSLPSSPPPQPPPLPPPPPPPPLRVVSKYPRKVHHHDLIESCQLLPSS